MVQVALVIFLGALLAVAGFASAAGGPSSAADPLPDLDRLWDYDHPDATEQKFRALLPAAEKAGNLSYLLQLQTQIARCQGLQGKFKECHAMLDSVEKQLNDAAPLARIRYLLERGRAFNSADHPDQARPLFVTAWEQANAANETGYAIDAAHMIAIVDPDVNAQVEWNLKALAKAQKETAQERWIPPVLNNLGEAYRARKEYDKALDCFEKCAQWYRDRHKEPDIFTLKDIARMNRLLGHVKTALAVIEPIALDLRSQKQPDGYISAEYGQCLAAAGRAAEAKPFLLEAFEMLSKDDYMVKYEPDELRRIKELAGIKN